MQGNRAEDRVGYLLKEAQHALRLAMDRALGERGLTTPQYAVLSALDEEPGLSNADLARRAFVTPQTMNSIVVLLERAGLVERQPHAVHGRVLSTILTPAGAELVQSCHDIVGSIEERMLAPLNDAQRAQLAIRRPLAIALATDRPQRSWRPARSQSLSATNRARAIARSVGAAIPMHPVAGVVSWKCSGPVCSSQASCTRAGATN